jgi:hypothetical protein
MVSGASLVTREFDQRNPPALTELEDPPTTSGARATKRQHLFLNRIDAHKCMRFGTTFRLVRFQKFKR